MRHKNMRGRNMRHKAYGAGACVREDPTLEHAGEEYVTNEYVPEKHVKQEHWT